MLNEKLEIDESFPLKTVLLPIAESTSLEYIRWMLEMVGATSLEMLLKMK